MPPVKYWKTVADRLHAQGWSYGMAEHPTKHDYFFASMRTAMETIIVNADDLLTAFLSLEKDTIAGPTGITEKM